MNLLPPDPQALVRTLLVGMLAYAALIAILRISGKRTLSQFNAFDFIVTVALGSTLATILLSREVSLAEGVLALALLVGLQFVISWTSVRSKRVARLAKSEPTALVYRGRVLDGAMRRERVVEDELRAAMRAAGHASVDELDLAILETDGSLSFLPAGLPGAWSARNVGGVPGAGQGASNSPGE